MNDTHSRKPVRFLWCEVKTPPFGKQARIEAGTAIARLQDGESLGLPLSRPMPGIGRRCHELRIADSENNVTWRIVYRIDPDAVLVAETFGKTTRRTPRQEIDLRKKRFAEFDRIKTEAMK